MSRINDQTTSGDAARDNLVSAGKPIDYIEGLQNESYEHSLPRRFLGGEQKIA